MNPALSQEFHSFCEQEQLQKHATLDKYTYCVYGTLKYGLNPGQMWFAKSYFWSSKQGKMFFSILVRARKFGLARQARLSRPAPIRSFSTPKHLVAQNVRILFLPNDVSHSREQLWCSNSIAGSFLVSGC